MGEDDDYDIVLRLQGQKTEAQEFRSWPLAAANTIEAYQTVEKNVKSDLAKRNKFSVSESTSVEEERQLTEITKAKPKYST